MFSRFLGVMNACGTVWIFLLMVLINSDIIGREVFGSPVRGTTELMSLSIVGIVFLQLGHTLMTGKVTRSDMVIDNLLAYAPRLGHGLQCLFHLGGAILLGIIFTGSLDLLQEALDIQEYVGAVGDFTAPTWPVRLIILVGSAATGLQFLLLAWQDMRIVLGMKS
ncbi:TRAP transporter small permease subunit [Ferrovibrio sp.]|uniref:TRAP transporter small permease subunit n=1 Tax=Ferrovibrio sp. TaxID=1917215 RepID=UPI00311E390D